MRYEKIGTLNQCNDAKGKHVWASLKIRNHKCVLTPLIYDNTKLGTFFNIQSLLYNNNHLMLELIASEWLKTFSTFWPFFAVLWDIEICVLMYAEDVGTFLFGQMCSKRTIAFNSNTFIWTNLSQWHIKPNPWLASYLARTHSPVLMYLIALIFNFKNIEWIFFLHLKWLVSFSRFYVQFIICMIKKVLFFN